VVSGETWRRSDRGLPEFEWACVRNRQTVRRARPLARRRLSTRRPPRVAMRARKPWLRARLSLLGW
jgi:hypothetical protein